MKLVHLSDLHLNTYFKHSNLEKIEYIIKYILSQKFDHIVITGDLTDNASPADFEILRKLFKTSGILNSDRLSLVIGNHDIFGGVQTAEDILFFPERCKLTNYELKVAEFKEYFSEAFDKCVYQSERIFPYAKIIDDVLIIGANSIAKYSKIKNPFASNGSIDIQQYGEISDILAQFSHLVNSKLMLIHHHFNKVITNPGNTSSNIWQKVEKQTMKLRKKKRLIRLFKNHGMDMVLHGHLHESTEYERDNLKFFNAGGCIKGYVEDITRINFIETGSGILNITTHNLYNSEIHNKKPADILSAKKNSKNDEFRISPHVILN